MWINRTDRVDRVDRTNQTERISDPFDPFAPTVDPHDLFSCSIVSTHIQLEICHMDAYSAEVRNEQTTFTENRRFNFKGRFPVHYYGQGRFPSTFDI